MTRPLSEGTQNLVPHRATSCAVLYATPIRGIIGHHNDPATLTMTKPDSDGTGRRYNRPEQEAKRLGISRRHLTNWMKDGSIPFIARGRVILFDPSAVDAALARFETKEVTRP